MTTLGRRDFMTAGAVTLGAIGAMPARGALPARVIVIGAGIMGASIGYHLARRGCIVTIIEKARPAAEATRNSFAWLNSYLKSPQDYYQLNMSGLMDWRRLALEIGPELKIRWGGSAQWADSDDKAAALRSQVAERQRLGDPLRLVDADELRALLPGIATGPVQAAAFSTVEATLDPVDATDTLLDQAQKFGAKIIYPCDVISLEADNGKIAGIVTSRGRMVADHYVLAAGVGSMALAAQVGLSVPLINKPGILAHSVPLPPIVDRVVVLPVGLGMGLKQNLDGRIVTGGHFGNNGDVEPTAELGREMLARAQRFFPKLGNARLDAMTLGHSVMPKDGLPIVGVDPRHPNLFVAAMDSGVTLAALIGRLAGIELIDGIATKILDPYRSSRFGNA